MPHTTSCFNSNKSLTFQDQACEVRVLVPYLMPLLNWERSLSKSWATVQRLSFPLTFFHNLYSTFSKLGVADQIPLFSNIGNE